MVRVIVFLLSCLFFFLSPKKQTEKEKRMGDLLLLDCPSATFQIVVFLFLSVAFAF